MANIIAAGLLLVSAAPPKTMTGYLSQYDLRPSVATLEYRQSIGDIPRDLWGYDGAIAVENCRYVGRDAMLRINDSPWLKVIIFDCAANDGTSKWFEESGVFGEINYGLALRYGLVGKGGIEGRLVIWPDA